MIGLLQVGLYIANPDSSYPHLRTVPSRTLWGSDVQSHKCSMAIQAAALELLIPISSITFADDAGFGAILACVLFSIPIFAAFDLHEDGHVPKR